MTLKSLYIIIVIVRRQPQRWAGTRRFGGWWQQQQQSGEVEEHYIGDVKMINQEEEEMPPVDQSNWRQWLYWPLVHGASAYNDYCTCTVWYKTSLQNWYCALYVFWHVFSNILLKKFTRQTIHEINANNRKLIHTSSRNSTVQTTLLSQLTRPIHSIQFAYHSVQQWRNQQTSSW